MWTNIYFENLVVTYMLQAPFWSFCLLSKILLTQNCNIVYCFWRASWFLLVVVHYKLLSISRKRLFLKSFSILFRSLCVISLIQRRSISSSKLGNWRIYLVDNHTFISHYLLGFITYKSYYYLLIHMHTSKNKYRLDECPVLFVHFSFVSSIPFSAYMDIILITCVEIMYCLMQMHCILYFNPVYLSWNY